MSIKVTARVVGTPTIDGSGKLSCYLEYWDIDNGYNDTLANPVNLTGLDIGLTAAITNTNIANAVRDSVNSAFSISRTTAQVMLFSGSVMFI